MPDIVKVEHADHVYQLDIEDLDGTEAGVLSRFTRDMGNVGVIYATLYLAKRRNGEKVSEAEVLRIKVRDWENRTNDDEEPEQSPPADAPAAPDPA